MDRLAIARALREIAGMMALAGENQFKVRAYETGAAALESLESDFDTLVREHRLQELRGIGAALAAVIDELHTTGRSALLTALRHRFPPGVAELAQVPEVGPKRALAIHQTLGITTIEQLRSACEAGVVHGIKGFGPKTEAKILEGIDRHLARQKLLLLDDALALAEPFLAWLRGDPAVEDASLAGDARRWCETVPEVVVVASTRNPKAAMSRLAAYAPVESVVARTLESCRVRLAGERTVVLHVAAPERRVGVLHRETGSAAHRARLQALAREQGLALGPTGLLDASGTPIPLENETELYRRLGLPFVPPELREDAGELEAALAGDTFEDLLELRDVRGMVHAHTTESDGRNSLQEMADAADALGLDYLTITDHSPSAAYAGGLDADRLRKQWDEIDRVQERVRVRLLKGTESDILEDGALDWPDRILERLDVVIASIHLRHGMDEERMTRRLVRAMSLPVFKIWGHALGRLLLRRDPIPCRVEEVLDTIARSPAAIEVNGDPNRLDLEPKWIRSARGRGIRFVVSTDAHSTGELRNLPYAVHLARRGGLRRGEVLNTLPFEAFREAVRPAAAVVGVLGFEPR